MVRPRGFNCALTAANAFKSSFTARIAWMGTFKNINKGEMNKRICEAENLQFSGFNKQ